MSRIRTGVPVVLLALWTVVVWGTRLYNVARDTGLGGMTRLGALTLAVMFCALAAASAGAVLAGWSTRLVQVFALVTAGVWAVRVPQILGADHSMGFKAVHVLLGLISVGLALAALRWAGRATRGSEAVGALGGSC